MPPLMRADAARVPLIFENDGPDIVATNFWSTPLAAAGAMFCSINAGAFRLLMPRMLEHQTADMVGREVIITHGPWPAAGQSSGLEMMWEDGSDAPFSVFLGAGQIDRVIARDDAGRSITCLAYVRGFSGTPLLAGRWPGKIRMAASLPCLRPWGG